MLFWHFLLVSQLDIVTYNRKVKNKDAIISDYGLRTGYNNGNITVAWVRLQED